MRALLEMNHLRLVYNVSTDALGSANTYKTMHFSRLFKFFSQEANSVFKGRKHQLLEGQCRHLSGYNPQSHTKTNPARLCTNLLSKE